MNIQLVCLSQRIQETVEEVSSLWEHDVQQLFRSSYWQIVVAERSDFVELLVVQRTLLIEMIYRSSDIQSRCQISKNVANTTLKQISICF